MTDVIAFPRGKANAGALALTSFRRLNSFCSRRNRSWWTAVNGWLTGKFNFRYL